jgi:hypothetical protein
MALSVFGGSWVSYCGFISYALFLFIYLQNEYKVKNKLPLVLTKRMVRLMITFIVLTIVFSMLSIFLVNGIALLTPDNFLLMNFRYAILCVFPVLVPFIVILAYIINSPYENAKNRKFAEEAAIKLASRENLIKIGITGSFGKTTVKEILKTISVLMTTAFAFVAGSAWNGAIEALITEVIGESGSAVTGMLIYAVVVTIVAVVVTLIIGRLVGKAGIDIDE